MSHLFSDKKATKVSLDTEKNLGILFKLFMYYLLLFIYYLFI